MSTLKLLKKSTLSLATFLMATSGCSGAPSISVLPSSDQFTQEGNEITAKMDIIWVIDNSGSMAEEQQALRDNFNEFMKDFVSNGYDFKMTVISTDAWYTEKGDRFDQGGVPYNDFTVNAAGGSGCEANKFNIVSSKFLDGNLTNDTRSNFPVISSADTSIDFSVTPPFAANNVLNIFATNSNLGIDGCGAESGLRSIEVALNDVGNAGFLRDDAHLAVIVVSDEVDQILDESTGSVTLNPDPVSYYHDFLNTKSPAGYSFHSIAELSQDACSSDGRFPGLTYGELSDMSGGVKASICGNFAASLGNIAKSIIETTVEFPLTSTPKSTDGAGFVVSVKNPGAADFVTIPKDPENGWTYNEERNSIIFHGTGVPAQNSELNIFYDPDGL